MIELISARDLQYTANGCINMIAQFSHIAEEVPFTASPNDVEAHGRAIHAKALNGDYGEVAPYIPPTAKEVSDSKRSLRMKTAVRKVQHYEMLDDSAMVADWKRYYAEVYNGVIDPIEPISI